MLKVFLALGSNVGNREENIEKAINLLSEKISDIKLANLYETKPVGYMKQNNFLNTAVSGYTALSPSELFEFIKEIEKKTGRIERFRWGPREIDIDILLYGNQVYKDTNIEIPHPRLHERDFVLQPLKDLNPKLAHPITKRTVEDMLQSIPKDMRSIVSL